MPLVPFLADLFDSGHVRLDTAPTLAPGESAQVVARLQAVFDAEQLDVAGERVPFDADVALDATRWLAAMCWALVTSDEQLPAPWTRTPQTASCHLSADIVLRYAAQLVARARLRETPTLSDTLTSVLRRWPLSGVLADIPGPPDLAPLGDHAGVQLLYAERLHQHPRDDWWPTGGRLREVCEWVTLERGGRVPALPTSKEPTV